MPVCALSVTNYATLDSLHTFGLFQDLLEDRVGLIDERPMAEITTLSRKIA